MAFFNSPTLNSPEKWANMRIGILGGSFDPPHEGHVHIALSALEYLQLDAIWWLVTPQNPLKNKAHFSFKQRIRLCEELTASYPKIVVSDLENQLQTTTTYDTVKAIKKAFPKTEFVWIGGMDNAVTLHTWKHWQDLLKEITMLHISRPPADIDIENSPLRNYEGQNHIFINKPDQYPLTPSTSYWLLQEKTVPISSTEIRENR